MFVALLLFIFLQCFKKFSSVEWGCSLSSLRPKGCTPQDAICAVWGSRRKMTLVVLLTYLWSAGNDSWKESTDQKWCAVPFPYSGQFVLQRHRTRFSNGTNCCCLTRSVTAETSVGRGRCRLSYYRWYWLHVTFFSLSFLHENFAIISLAWVKILCYIVMAQSNYSWDLGSPTSNRGLGWMGQDRAIKCPVTEWL